MKGKFNTESLLLMDALLYIPTFSTQERLHICTLKWPDSTAEIVWNISFTTLCFLLPGLIIVVSYSKILQVGLLCSLTGNSARKCWKGPVKGWRPFKVHGIPATFLRNNAFCALIVKCGKTLTSVCL